MKPIYLDYASTTPVDPRVVEKMQDCLTFEGDFGNAGSRSHSFGWKAEELVEEARLNVANLVTCDPREIIFTSGATESDNLAIKGAAYFYKNKGKHIVTSKIEHKAVLDTCRQLEKEGFEVTYLDVDEDGSISPETVKEALRDDTTLVSLMHINNEIGVINEIEKIGEITRDKGILFHVDAAQSAGKIPINLDSSCIDLMSFSAHKIYGPKGIGALYIRRKPRVRLHIIGGHQERGRRGGTENVSGIAALGKAAELAQLNLPHIHLEQELRDYLEDSILNLIPDTVVNGNKTNRLPNTTNIGFKYIEGEAILLSINKYGICASSGSACTSGSLEPSHVLRAMKVPYSVLHGSIRFSLSRYTTKSEIDRVIEILPDTIGRLRAISPFSSDNSTWLQEMEKEALAK
jgi:cysteine desulfurase